MKLETEFDIDNLGVLECLLVVGITHPLSEVLKLPHSLEESVLSSKVTHLPNYYCHCYYLSPSRSLIFRAIAGVDSGKLHQDSLQMLLLGLLMPRSTNKDCEPVANFQDSFHLPNLQG